MPSMPALARLALLALLVAAACGGGSSNKPGTKPGKVVVSEAAIEILDPITFTGEVELPPSSQKTLDAMAATLNGNPSLELVEVGVSVTTGDEAARQALADRRAQAVVDYLVGKQVEAARLAPAGYTGWPGEPSSSEEVRFLVIRRGPGG
jgi:ABC-type glycerol-3-phosphate transport system substrate-binding protein